MGLNLKVVQKVRFSKSRIEQIEQYLEEIDDNAKQFARELNELPMSEDNGDELCFKI